MSKISYRNPTENDIEDIVRVINSSKRELPGNQNTTAENVDKRMFKDPNSNQSHYWLAVADREIVGFCEGRIDKSRIDAGKSDSFVGIEVIPGYRGRGIEKELMKLSLEYLKSKNIKIVQNIVSGVANWRHNVTSEFGFKDVRHYYHMICKNRKRPPTCNPPHGIVFEDHISKETSNSDLEKTAKIYNETFSGHFNYSPITVDMLIRVRDNNTTAKQTTLAKDGEKIIGVCTYEEDTPYNKKHNTRIGYIDMLGVSKPYRKRGIGRSLLSHGMKWLHEQGVDTIHLNVDGKNDSALELYNSLDFRLHMKSIVYQLEL